MASTRRGKRGTYSPKDKSLWEPLIDFLNRETLEPGDMIIANTSYLIDPAKQQIVTKSNPAYMESPLFKARASQPVAVECPECRNSVQGGDSWCSECGVSVPILRVGDRFDFTSIDTVKKFKEEAMRVLDDFIKGQLESFASGLSTATTKMRYFPATVVLKPTQDSYVIDGPYLILEDFRAYFYHVLSVTLKKGESWRFGRCKNKYCRKFFLRKIKKGNHKYCTDECRLHFHNYLKAT